MPVRSQLGVELRCAFFRKENPRALHLDALSCTRNRRGEPLRPFDVEVDVIGTPHDQGRYPQGPKLALDGDCMTTIEGGEKALEVSQTLRAAQEWLQVQIDGLVADEIRALIRETQPPG